MSEGSGGRAREKAAKVITYSKEYGEAFAAYLASVAKFGKAAEELYLSLQILGRAQAPKVEEASKRAFLARDVFETARKAAREAEEAFFERVAAEQPIPYRPADK